MILANAAPGLNALVERLGYPCTNTLMGLGGCRGTSGAFLGMPGLHGTYEANMAMQNCDVLIAIGARFDDRVIGNASGLNAGAAALVLMERSVAERRGIRPLARLVSYAHAGVDPEYMGIGPVPASRKALERAGLTTRDIDVVEANEAFAAQACAVSTELGLDPAKVNPNGSGIGLGHPIGATGAIISVKALYELQRTGGRYALVTMCIGGGQGIAAIFGNPPVFRAR